MILRCDMAKEILKVIVYVIALWFFLGGVGTVVQVYLRKDISVWIGLFGVLVLCWGFYAIVTATTKKR